MPNLQRMQEISKELQKISVELMGDEVAGCVSSGKSCVHRQSEKHKTNFHAYNPAEMCDVCATYWHTSCAYARAMIAARRIEIIEAEREEKARALAKDEEDLQKMEEKVQVLRGGGKVDNLTLENGERTIVALKQTIANKKRAMGLS